MSVSPLSFRLMKTIFWTGRPSSALLQNIPPQKDKKVITRQQPVYRVISVNENNLRTVQHVLENTIFNHWAILNPISRHHCDDEPSEKDWYPSEEDPRSDRESCDNLQWGNENTYVIDKTLWHAGCGPAFDMWSDGTGTVGWTVPPNHLTLYCNILPARTGNDSRNGKR